jgi:hypothetical protein
VFWDSDEDKFQTLTDFHTVEEACAFLDVIDWDFDYYEPKEILFVREMIRRVESRP